MPPTPKAPKPRGRRPKFDAQQQAEAVRLIAIEGLSQSEVARRMGVDRATVSRGVAQRAATSKNVANQIVSAEAALLDLPNTQQAEVLDIAAHMRAASASLARASVHGARLSADLLAMMSARVAALAQRVAAGEAVSEMQLGSELSLAKLAGEASRAASHIPLALIKPEVQDAIKPPPAPADTSIPDDPVEAAKAYQELIKS